MSVDWLDVLIPAALETLKISVIAAVLSAVVGFLAALGCLSRRRTLRGACRAYIEVLRAIPLLVLLILAYYGLGERLEAWHIGAFTVAVVVLVANEGAYTAEVYRSALLSIDRGQWHAGASLGLSERQTLRLVVLPQFARIALQPTVNMLIYVIKGSALASLITVEELTLVSQRLVAETFQPLEVYLMAGAIYLLITMPLGYLVYFIGGRVDKRVKTGAGPRPRVRLGLRGLGARQA